MPEDTFRLDVDAEDVMEAMRRAPRVLARNIKQASDEVSKEILGTRGLQNYPPETSANRPPTPYYERGRGMWYSWGNDGSSENYGKQFNTRAYADRTVIGNKAPYAEYVGGEWSPHHMRVKGWRRLIGVARQKMATGVLSRIYNRWIERALRTVGLIK